ncbi:MAG TPA: hypothetical protein VGE31_01685, partial [Candidatus Paceibacterota bacterium]
MESTIRKNVMRRVYYSYAIDFMTQPMLWQGILLGMCVALFGRLTHVASILHNFAATRIENAPAFVWNSFVHAYNGGEVLTVLVVLFMVGLSLSLITRLLLVFSSMQVR